MIRNLKALGLLAFAAFAMSAMFASAASAEGEKGTFTAGETPETHKPATIVGEQYPDPPEAGEEWNYFQREKSATKIRCDTAIFTGTTKTGTETQLTITPHYRHCYTEKGEEIRPVTVTTNECDFIFTQPTTVEPLDTGKYTGKVDLTCPKKNKIQIHVYGFGNSTQTSHFFNVCTIEVYPTGEEVEGHTTQELGGHVIYQNLDEPPKDDITVKATVEKVTSSTNCPGEEAHDTEGTYKQTVTVKAFDDIDDAPNPTVHDIQYDAWISD